MTSIDIAIEEGTIEVSVPTVVVDVAVPQISVDVETSGPPGPPGPAGPPGSDADVDEHEAKPDPHPQYLTAAEGDAQVAAHDALATAHAALRGTLPPVAASAAGSQIGTSTKFSREDHRHAIPVGVPVDLGPANAAGTITSLSRSDHVHRRPTAAEVGAEAAGAVTAHEGKADPHPQYVTAAELGAALPPESDASGNTTYGTGTPPDLKGTQNTAVGKSALAANLTGANNMAVGAHAMEGSTAAQNSVGIGLLALSASNGSDSVAIGAYSLMNAVNGLNVAIGATSLLGLTTGVQNIAIGHAAGHSSVATTTQNYQTFIGSGAEQYTAGSGDNATSIGHAAKAHGQATAVGALAEARGIRSTAVGYGAVAALDNQIMLGTAADTVYAAGSLLAAGHISSTGGNVIAVPGSVFSTALSNVGYVNADINISSLQGINLRASNSDALRLRVAPDGQVTVAADPSAPLGVATKQYVDTKVAAGGGGAETDAALNTGYGLNSLLTITTGAENTALGEDALKNVGAGSYNTAVGTDAHRAGAGTANTAMGHRAQTGMSGGTYNTGVGYGAQYSLTTGANNVAAGAQAQQSITTGGGNVAAGATAGYSISTGSQNTGLGHAALYQPKAVSANATTTASYQTAVGSQAGAYAAGTGNRLVAVGYQAVAHTEATALGSLAEARGIRSTAVGYGAIATLDNQIMLGTAADTVEVPGAFKVAGSPVWKAWTGSQAAYDAIGTKDPGTLYVVV